MKEEKIFWYEVDQDSGRVLIVSENEHSIWAYLTRPNSQEIEKSCFLFTRNAIPDSLKESTIEFTSKSAPPPITKQFASNRALFSRVRVKDLSVKWNGEGGALLLVKNEPYLLFPNALPVGFSKSLHTDGPFGNAWDDRLG